MVSRISEPSTVWVKQRGGWSSSKLGVQETFWNSARCFWIGGEGVLIVLFCLKVILQLMTLQFVWLVPAGVTQYIPMLNLFKKKAVYMFVDILGGDFKLFVYFHPYLGKRSNLTIYIYIIFFKWVGSTTNQYMVMHVVYARMIPWLQKVNTLRLRWKNDGLFSKQTLRLQKSSWERNTTVRAMWGKLKDVHWKGRLWYKLMINMMLFCWIDGILMDYSRISGSLMDDRFMMIYVMSMSIMRFIVHDDINTEVLIPLAPAIHRTKSAMVDLFYNQVPYWKCFTIRFPTGYWDTVDHWNR